MPNTMTLIASSTVGAGGASTIVFSSIPATYTDLQCVYSIRSSESGAFGGLFITANIGTPTSRSIVGTGASIVNENLSYLEPYTVGSTATANTFGNGSFYIPNYAGSNYKSISVDNVSENNGTTAIAMLGAGLLSSTSAITSLTLAVGGSTIQQYSTAYLYGVKNA